MNKTTVVIVNWNGEKYLDKLISSLMREDCNILVVDNNSSDKSGWMAEFALKGLDDGKYIQLNTNWGFAVGNNIGAAMVETENILFLNNDILPKKGFLKAMEDKISSDYPIVGAKLIFGETKKVPVYENITFKTIEGKVQHAGIGICGPGLPHEIGRNFEPDDQLINFGKEVSGVTGACMLVKTKVFTKLRGFNTNFINGYEDVDFCWRARENGYKSWYEPKAELIHFCSTTKGRFDKEIQNSNLLKKLWNETRTNNLRIK